MKQDFSPQFVAYTLIYMDFCRYVAKTNGCLGRNIDIARSDICAALSPAPCRNIKPIRKAPSEYLKQLYFDSMVFTSEGLRHLVAEAGVGQVLMGTDFPAGWTNDAVDHILSTSTLSDADKRAILGENAARLLRIPG